MMGLHSPSWSRGKLPLWGGIGLAVFCPPPGPPKLIAPGQVFSTPGRFRLSRYWGAFCCKRLLLKGRIDNLGGQEVRHHRFQPYNIR